eukprot:755037-Hanusia_phi.AAC.1
MLQASDSQNRMKSVRRWQEGLSVRSEHCHTLRIIGASASIPNLDDIGSWIGAPVSHVCLFGEEYRPIPLEYKVLGYPSSGKSEFVFDKNLNFKIPGESCDNSLNA